MKTNNRINPKNKQVVILGGIGLTLIALIGMYLYFGSHFFWGATANDIDISGLSTAEAKQKLAKELKQKSITLIGTNGKTTLTISEPYEIKEEYLKKNIREKDLQLPLRNNLKQTLKGEVAQLSLPKEQPSKNASIQYDKNRFVISAEKIGTVVDREKLAAIIYENLRNGKDIDQYNLKNFYQKPEVTKKELQQSDKLQQLQSLMNKKVKIKINKDTLTIPKKTLINLVNDSGNPDQGKIQDCLAGLNTEYSTVNQPVDFTNIHGDHLQYDNIGNYGWSIDTVSSATQIAKAMTSKKEKTIKLKLSGDPKKQPLHVKKDYVEVDLDNQRMYCFRNGKKIIDTPVITGQYTKGTATVPGFHMIMDRKKDVSLSGTLITGDGTYSVPVNYWLPILSYGQTITGIGFHDTGHKEEHFGEKEAYKSDLGSYGCVNTPENAVAKLYKNSYVGMPVFIYGHTYDNAPGEYDKPVSYGTLLADKK